MQRQTDYSFNLNRSTCGRVCLSKEGNPQEFITGIYTEIPRGSGGGDGKREKEREGGGGGNPYLDGDDKVPLILEEVLSID